MRETYRHAFARYLAALAACIVVALCCAAAGRSIAYAPAATLALTVTAFCALLLAFQMTVEIWVMKREARDWSESCEPILAEYEASGDADAFIAAYEGWRKGQHTANTRFEFLRELALRLAADGYAGDAEVALSGLASMARTPWRARRYERARQECRRELARARQQ